MLTPPSPAEGGSDPAEAGQRDADGDGYDDESGELIEGDAAQGAAQPAAPVLALPESTFRPVHEEIREDRLVLYGSVSNTMQEFRYRIRATATGTFQVPPIFAEHMYRNGVIARGGPAGTIIVTEPAR